MSAYFQKCWQQTKHPLWNVQKFFYGQVCCGHMKNSCVSVRMCACEGELDTRRECVGVCCVQGLCESMFCESCSHTNVFRCPTGKVLNNRPFLTAWDAVSCQLPRLDWERKRKWERERVDGGLRVFRLIGGQHSAFPPARTDSWNLWAVSTALPLKDFLSDNVYKRWSGSQ